MVIYININVEASHTFITKDQLVLYCLRKAGRISNNVIGPIYSVSPILQRGHGIGSFFESIFCIVIPIVWRGVNDVGQKTLRTVGKILRDIAVNMPPDINPREIVSKREIGTAEILIQMLRGRGCKSVDGKSREKQIKNGNLLRRKRSLQIGISSPITNQSAEIVILRTEIDIFAPDRYRRPISI
jgi:hypothetical protein